MDRQTRKREEATLAQITNIVAAERVIYTLNEHYYFDYREKFRARYKSIYQHSRGQRGTASSLREYDAQNISDPTLKAKVDKALSALADLGIRGLVPGDLAKLLPDDEQVPALEIMAEVRAYFQGELHPDLVWRRHRSIDSTASGVQTVLRQHPTANPNSFCPRN